MVAHDGVIVQWRHGVVLVIGFYNFWNTHKDSGQSSLTVRIEEISTPRSFWLRVAVFRVY